MARRLIGGRTVGWSAACAAVLVAVVVAVTWKAASPLAFLLYPVLVLGVLLLGGLVVLWALKFF
ncbi:MAG: hypothetical protein QN178_10305 [Armatimonadota bacterium]|nr:hypothetical protein [Armatimonadota bacterium]